MTCVVSMSNDLSVAILARTTLNSVSLIITTYNRADALDLVLRTVALQSRIPNEIIIADDGSLDATKQVIDRWKARLSIKHIWLPDQGFRAARSRNLAVLKSSCNYIVMVDGDCLLPESFVENHLKLAAQRRLVAGGRYLYSEELTKYVLSVDGDLDKSIFTHLKFLSLRLSWLRNIISLDWKHVRTCNIAVCRSEILAVNGFDEAYVGWGREDSDLIVRLMRNSVRLMTGRLYTCVGHLYHKEGFGDASKSNELKFGELLKSGSLGQYLPSKSVLEQS